MIIYLDGEFYVIYLWSGRCICDNIEAGMAQNNLTGSRFVRAIRPAFDDVNRLCPRTKDRVEIRSHALKLRYWPERNPLDDAGRVLDLNWCWVRAMQGQAVGELRLDDTIGGNDNLRIIFLEGPPDARLPMPVIWILRVMQKKRDDFSVHDLKIFKARRALVLERFYKRR